MTAVLSTPTPIDFVLPDGWRAALPHEPGAADATVVAWHEGRPDGFVACLTADVHDDLDDLDDLDEFDLVAAADRSVRMRSQRGVVRVTDRVEGEAADPVGDPRLSQLLNIFTTMGGMRLNLVRREAYFVLRDEAEPGRRTPVEVALTSTPGQLGEIWWDFEAFVRSLRVAPASVSV